MPKRWISKISVTELFGEYSYNLEPNATVNNVNPLILYGDNGCGKTTLLKMIFHLLASEDSAGHKTFLSRTMFKDFTLEFSDGTIVSAYRDTSKCGSFLMDIYQSDDEKLSYFFVADDDFLIKSSIDENEAEYYLLLKALNDLFGNMYYLSDDRTLHLSGNGASKNERYIITEKRQLIEESESQAGVKISKRSKYKSLEDIQNGLVKDSIERVESYYRHLAVQGGLKGDSDVNAMYNRIIESILTVSADDAQEKEIDRQALLDRVSEIQRKSKEYSRYGLLPKFKTNNMVDALNNISADRINYLDSVLRPYIESMEAKLKALETVQKSIDIFIDLLDGFFVKKKVSFKISKGLEIKSRNGTVLSPEQLSSGEKHLLLLFCNALNASHNRGFFIIDEPEISLNIKWQRKLINSLLKCFGDNPVQFLLATHSFEILAKHSDNVLEFEK